MKLSKKILYAATLAALALPFIVTGESGAVRYNPDGAVQNAVTGVYELPEPGGCFDGTATINAGYTNRPDCINAANGALNAITTRSACQTYVQITSPAGYDLKSGTASWGRCSKGTYTADQATCEGAGGSWDAFTRCNRQLSNTDCNQLATDEGISVTASGSGSSAVCTTTALTATECATGGTVNAKAWMGSAAVTSGPTTTCTVYYGDLAGCTAAGGTLSTTNTDETRGNCFNAWVFKQVAGDGATTTNPGTSGSLTTVEARACLRCHNSTYQGAGSPFAEPEKYIYASHKNASRKITANKNWAQINENSGSEAFSVFTNYKDRAIDWVNGLIEKAAGSGTWTDWYWYWGYFFEDPTDGSDIAENSVSATTGLPTQNFRACAYCHGTGFSAENTLDTTKEPVKSFGAGIAWDGTTTYAAGSTPGKINLKTGFLRSSDDSLAPTTADCTALGGVISGTGTARVCRIPAASTTQNACVKGGTSIPGSVDWTGPWIGSWNSGTGCTVTVGYNYNSWDEFGVLCSNCHNSVDGGHNNSASGTRKNVPRPTVTQPAYGAQVNAVCLQCHAKSSSSTGQLTAPASQPLAASAYVTTGHPNYHGSQFMNSPHARFSGTYAQVTDTTKYNSAFATNYGGCTGCHNPHGSARENLLDATLMGAYAAEEGITTSCASCHVAAQGSAIPVSASNINHPTGTGTPMGDVSAPTDGCVICHMPRNSHLFRISTDNVTPKADGSYTDAAWNTATTVCQQCHGSVAFTMTAAQAAAGAIAMHSGGSATNSDCLTCHVAGNTVGAPEITPGTNHHGLYADCVECHSNGHNGTLPDKHDNSFCLGCHTNTGSHAVHHAVSTVTAECVSCHTTPGVLTAAQENTTDRDTVTAQCLGCHSSAQTRTTTGTTRALIVTGTGDNHHRGSNPSVNADPKKDRVVAGCLYCHAKGKPFGDASTEVMQDQQATGACNGACHSSTLPTSGQHHTGAGLTPTNGFICLSCHTVGSDGRGPGAPGVTDPAVWPPANWEDCTACHSSGGLNGPSTSHHIIKDDPWTDTTCGVCHTYAGQRPAVTTCAGCHTSKQQGLINHPVTSALGTPDCSGCHAVGGSLPTASVCNNCHTSTSGPAPFLSASKLQKILKAGVHRNVKPVASMIVTVDGMTATVKDTSTDFDGNIASVVIDWGDKVKTPVATGGSASHTYAKNGKKTITLTVIDSRGVKSTAKSKIVVPQSI